MYVTKAITSKVDFDLMPNKTGSLNWYMRATGKQLPKKGRRKVRSTLQSNQETFVWDHQWRFASLELVDIDYGTGWALPSAPGIGSRRAGTNPRTSTHQTTYVGSV